jgi:hypothetical protein
VSAVLQLRLCIAAHLACIDTLVLLHAGTCCLRLWPDGA